MMFFAFSTVLDDVVDDLLLIVIVFLRKKNILCAVCDTAPKSDISGITSHNLDDRASLMGSGSISYFINGFHCSVYRGIKTDGIFCAGDIQVDGSRYTYGVNSKSCQFLRSCKRSVSADNYQSVDAVFSADICSTFLAFRQTSSYGCTDRCVHTWCITTAGKHSDCLYLVSRCHMNSSISSHTLINE